jgi:hypothetical protein
MLDAVIIKILIHWIEELALSHKGSFRWKNSLISNCQTTLMTNPAAHHPIGLVPRSTMGKNLNAVGIQLLTVAID